MAFYQKNSITRQLVLWKVDALLIWTTYIPIIVASNGTSQKLGKNNYMGQQTRFKVVSPSSHKKWTPVQKNKRKPYAPYFSLRILRNLLRVPVVLISTA